MPSLQDLRAKLPDLEGLDDRNAIEYIREVYYPDRTAEHLAQRLGVKPAAPPVEDAGLVSRAKDVGVSLLKSTIGVPETMVGLADIPTGGRVGKFLENEGGAIGFRPKEANAALDEMYSPAQKAANREVQQADGIVDTLGAAVANPSTIAHGALTSLGTLLAGAPLGKAALWLGTNAAQRAAIGLLPKAEQGAALSAASRTPGWAAGGLAEGGAAAGQNLEQVRQETKDGLVTPEQTAIIAASGALTGVIAGVAGKVANSLGIGDINQMVAGARQAGPAVQKGLARRIAEGFATEGILQEFPQSAQEQIAQNVALGKPWDEGVGNAAVMGALSGGLIGGVAGPFHGKHPPTGGDGDSGDTGTPPPAPPQTQVPVVGTLSSAANTAIDAQAHVQRAEAAQAAPAPAALTPEHAAAVLARAGERKAELEAKAKGVPDQDVDSGKDGEKVTIKGTPGQMLTPDEKAELDVLSEHGGDAQKMSTIYATAAPTGTATAAEAPDELLDAARDYVREAGKISPSGIQKHLRIGYQRAQRLVEALKEEAKPKAAPKITPAMLARKGLAIPGAISPEAALDRTHRAAATDEAIQRATGREGESPPAPPAPPKIQPPTAEHASDTEPPHLPTDMLHPTKGVPYTLRGAAVRAQKSLPNPDAVVIASVKGGYVLRPVAAPAKPKESPNVQPPAAAATSGVEGVAPTVDEAAHAAATSPENELPQPTPAQKEAGNYAKGHVKVAGLDVSIENPAGSVRSGVDKGGKAWSNTLQHHYGYVKGTVGNDKDHFDVFIKPGTTEDHAGPVFVIDQYHDNGGGAFDEHKGLIGFSDIEEAKAAYLSNYAKGWRGMRAISTMPMGEFKTWVRDGEKNKPLVPFSTAKGPATSAPGTALAKNLTVTFGGKTYPVSSVEDARDKWEQFRDQSAGGVSVIGNGVRVLDGAGKFVGRVSYNGRIWHEEDGLGSKGEKAPVASAQALPAQASPNPPSAAAPAPGDAPARARLEKVAERLGVKVFKAAGGFHATGDSVDIPDDDVQVQSAVSPLHVFAHELGHAVMHKRGLSFKGFPKTEVLKRIENYDELIAASKAYRPGVHGHENPRYRRHAMTPNEVIADAIGSVLIGQSDIALLQPMMKSMGLTERDLGLADAPAAKPVTVTKAGAGATAIVIDPSAGRPASSANTIFTEDAAAAARARLKAKLGRLQSGLDPETIMDGITLAGYHIEKGARTFAAYARAMVDDLGEAVKPYLQSWYMAVRSDPRAAGFKADMDKASVVEDLDATATPDAEWPGAAELEKARAAHKEVLARLAAPKVAAPVVAPGSTNLAQTGAPEANEADVLYSLNFDDLGSEDYLSHDEYWGKQAVPRVQAHRRLTKLTEALKSGAISQEEFNDGVDVLAMRLGTVAATKQANRLMSERKRGVRRARIKLNEAVEQGDLDADTADFALWALEKNPALATDLSFSFRKSTDSTPAGDYDPAAQIVRVFKGGSRSDTAVHEILHHAERMMPEDVQDAIRKEWAKAVGKALKEAAKDPNPMVLEALNDLLVAKPGTEAWNRIVKAFKGGILDYRKHYQLTNASEWWAVNGASILQARYEADGWVAKARQWLKEMIEHLKAMFGGASHAAVLRGLESVLGATGERLSPEMLNQNDAPAASLGFRDVLNAGTDRLRATRLPAGRLVGDYLEKSGKLHWWHKTVGTMHHLAKLHPTTFGRVYNAVQDFLNDVSSYATEAADLAPNILPKLETWKDIGKSPMSAADTKAVSKATFDGTLKWVRDENGQARKRDELQEEMADIEIDDKAHKLLRAGDIAPEILRMWQGLPMEQYEKIIEGKFEKRFLSAGVVFTPAELKEHFGLTGARKADGTYSGQIGLYQESRASIDNSLKNLGLSQMLRSGGKDVEGFEQAAMGMSLFDASQMLRDHLFEMAEAEPDRADELNAKGNQMVEIAERAIKLQEQGYAPLSRFGTYTLDATVDGEHFFSLYESKADRAKAVRMLRAAGATDMRSGVLSKEEYKLLDGITPETAAIFGEMLGLESQGSEAKDLAYQEFLRKAIANQSAMKRLIHRKGIAGYSEDVGRVLAGFVYSNARQISRNLHAGEIDNAVADIPQGQGDLKDAAVQLREYVKNPQEEAAWIRGLLFAQYLGGSVASAIVNMTQPLAITFPYLSQYGGAVAAGKRVAKATADALKAKTGDDELDAALKHAEAEGIVSPQEVHQLQAQAMGKAALRSGDGTAFGTAGAAVANTQTRVALAWGKVFGVAEQFNRRITFIAAYRTAVAQGIENPAKFAKKTVEDTQFTYNKGSKPKWARGAIGSTAFTFKQYSINYVELLHRMWVHGGPEGKRAALLALAVLFVLSGADGLPFEADIEDVIDGALQRMGYNFQTKQAKMEFLTRVLGSDGARIVAKGLSGLPGAPLDVSGRLGMGNLVPGTGLFTKKDDHTSDVLELAGPVSDLIKRAATATGQVLTGQVGKGLTTAAPNAASNAVKGVKMWSSGAYADDRGRKVIDTTTGEAVLKGIGFQPNTVSRVQDATRQAQIMISQAKMRESEIADQWAVAKFERDPEKVQAAKDALARWNRDNPTSRITITVPQINKRVNAMRQTKAQRIEKTAPKEIRAMVRRELAGADQ